MCKNPGMKKINVKQAFTYLHSEFRDGSRHYHDDRQTNDASDDEDVHKSGDDVAHMPNQYNST